MPSVSIVIFVVLVITPVFEAATRTERRSKERILLQPRPPRLQSGLQYFSKSFNELFDLGESAT